MAKPINRTNGDHLGKRLSLTAFVQRLNPLRRLLKQGHDGLVARTVKNAEHTPGLPAHQRDESWDGIDYRLLYTHLQN